MKHLVTSYKMEHVVLTGGIGYIGSHTVLALIENNYKVSILDINCNCDITKEIKDNLLKLIPINKKDDIKFYNVDITDEVDLDDLFSCIARFDTCIHFAALKNVEESIRMPLEYYMNNVSGLITLLSCCKRYQCHNFIFSSSCTIYGNNETMPCIEKNINEIDIRTLTNPYAVSKYMCEKILDDYCKSDSKFKCICLRYFNPIGAHSSGLLGDNPIGNRPSNIIPTILNVMSNKQDKLEIYGMDYDTKDGTCARDYVHVVDVANAHVKSIKQLKTLSHGCAHVYNIGTGKSTTILELIGIMTNVTKKTIPSIFMSRRDGDVSEAYANTSKSFKELGFFTKYNMEDMCKDAYNFIFQKYNKK